MADISKIKLPDGNAYDVKDSSARSSLSSKVDDTASGANALFAKLSEGTSTPADTDHYISQYAGGGTTTLTYHRRTYAALWEWIKSKANSVYAKVSHTHTKSQITDFPTIPTKTSQLTNDSSFLTSHQDISGLMPKSGGAFTGNVTGKYFTGTWLQTTAATELSSAPSKIAVLDGSGWIYWRGLTNLKSDMGVSPTITTTTMSASSWNKTAKTYSFESTYPFKTYDIEIEPSDTCTSAQRDAWDAARLSGSATSNVAKAYGEVPTVNIPIIVKATKR